MSSRKRKHRTQPNHDHGFRQTDSYRQDESQPPDPVLFIQAYEADIVKGPSGSSMARALEIERDTTGHIVHVGQSLMKLNIKLPVDGDGVESNDSTNNIWVDRYDLPHVVTTPRYNAFKFGMKFEKRLAYTHLTDMENV